MFMVYGFFIPPNCHICKENKSFPFPNYLRIYVHFLLQAFDLVYEKSDGKVSALYSQEKYALEYFQTLQYTRLKARDITFFCDA